MALSEDATTGQALPTRMLESAISQRQQWGRDALALWNYPIAAVDTVATSIVNIPSFLAGADPTVESFVPASAERYHRNRYGYDAVGSTALMFAGIGTILRGVQLTGAVGRLGVSALGPERARSVFSWMNEVRDVDNMMAQARITHAVAMGSQLRRNSPVLDMTATTAGTSLAAYGRNYGEVQSWLRSARTTQAIKQAIAVEVTLAGAFNNSDFLFPDEFGPMAYLMIGGLGVGLSVGIEHLLGRTAMRHGLRAAATAGEQAAQAARRTQTGAGPAGLGVDDTLFNVVGEEWQGLMAQIYHHRLTRELEAAIPAISGGLQNSVSPAALMATVRAEDAAVTTLMNGHLGRMAQHRLSEPTLRSGFGNSAAVSAEYKMSGVELEAIRRRVMAVDMTPHGLAELGDAGMASRFQTLMRATDDAQIKAVAEIDRLLEAGAEVDFIRAAQNALDEVRTAHAGLRRYRAATIERTGVPNYNGNRRAPWEETAQGRVASLVNSRDGLRFSVGVDRTPQIVITKRGTIGLERSQAGMVVHDPVDFASLTFDESSAFAALVDRASASQAWQNDFWAEFLQNPSLTYAKMPYQVLDAIAAGKISMPASLAGMPRGMQVTTDISTGAIRAASLLQKYDTFRALRADGGFSFEDGLDQFDLEKVLNLRLTDNRGLPNLLFNSLRAFEQQGLDAASVLAGGATRAQGTFDRAFELGMGYRDLPIGFAADETEFYASLGANLRNIDNDKAQGIGAVYHVLREPTDLETQLGFMIRNRNAVREQAFHFDSPEVVRNVSNAMRGDEISFVGAKEGSKIFLDTTVGNNTYFQTTHAHAIQNTLGHAHTQGQLAQVAIDAIKVERLKPIEEMDRAFFADVTGAGTRVMAEYGQAYQAVSRGIALVQDHYTAGLNAIDMSRPGATNLMKMMGNLENAPPPGQPWHLFDMTLAATERRYVPIQLSEEGASRLNMSTNIQYQLLDAENFLRIQAGLPSKQRLSGHLPAPDFSRYEMRYLADPMSNRVVGYIKGRTPQEADAELARAMAAFNERNPGKPIVAMKAEQIREYYEITDQNFLSSLQDWSGYRQTGTAKGGNMDFRMPHMPELLSEHMVAMRNSFDDIKDRTVTGVFSQAFSNTRRTAAINGGDVAERGKHTYFTAAEQWENLLLARDRLPIDSLARRAHDWIDSLYNTTVGRMTDILPWHVRAADAILNGTDSKMLAKLNAPQRKFVEDMIDNYTPFNALTTRPDLTDYIKPMAARDPFKLRRNLQSVNRASAALMLKHINIAHPILNALGMAVTLPAVRSQMTRRATETAAEFSGRIGYLADYIDPERGFATMNSAKLMQEAYHRVFSDTSAYEYAAKHGMLNANMLEEINKYNTYNMGRSKTDIFEGFLEMTDIYNRVINFGMRKAGKEPSAFSISERSEPFVRAIAHMAGLTLIEQSGREGISLAAKHSFAQKFSNLTIADFAQGIRGEAFRGSAGIPFGLFQSYSINIYQRLLRMVAEKDRQTLAIQAMTQVGIFGVGGLPGWEQLNALYFNSKDMRADERGATSLNERVHAALGKGMADLLMSGSLSSLPRLLGADTGLNLYSSGDLNFQSPMVPPAFSLAQQTVQGLYEGLRRGGEELRNVAAGRDGDPWRVAEVMANYGPSRGFRSLTDLAIGERIDRRGNLVVDDTRTGVALISRLLGVRTMNEMQISAALWENSQAQAQRITDMGRVRSQMLRGFRDGTLDEDTAVQWLDRYMTAGGREDQWPRWLNYTAEMATDSRAERALARVIARTGEIYEHHYPSAMRLHNAGVDLNVALPALPGGPDAGADAGL